MGEKNSSSTRVQLIFNALLDGWTGGERWVRGLCEIASATRAGNTIEIPDDLGTLRFDETPLHATPRHHRVFERAVAPPTAFLHWLLEHPQRMHVADGVTFNATSEPAQEWRRKLFSHNQRLAIQAQRAALAHLKALGGQGSRRAWWAFEGFTHIDCCLITERFVLFVEGKRRESTSPSTRWFPERSQLWRNVEAAQQFAHGREFAAILGVEEEADGVTTLHQADQSLERSYPHLAKVQRLELSRHFLGFVTWQAVVRRFALPATCLAETVGTGTMGNILLP